MASVVFIDSRVSDYEILVEKLDPLGQWFLLDAERDGIEQIRVALAGRSGLNAIHIVSHGSEGVLYLGSTVLDSAEVGARATALAEIGASLKATGDILLYGCNVVAGEVGQGFIDQLAQATGADVAASEDITGAAFLGGDWVLEQASGSVETSPLTAPAYAGTLDTITGDASDNILSGTANADSISGLAGNDTLEGGAGNDSLDGGDGNDTLIGGGGADSFTGGTGDDLIYVDSDDVVVTEYSNEGTDTVSSSINLTLAANIENLILTGSATVGAGDTAANSLTGNAQANTLTGGDGNDTLTGGTGNDTLDGGSGNDSMVGGAGADSYIVEAAGDVVQDFVPEVSIQLASTAADGTQVGGTSGQISADGHYVVFQSGAANLVAGDTNNTTDIFVKDLQNGSIQRVSTAADGTQANNLSQFAQISADGRYVVFESSASNLVAGDTNNTSDIFVKDLQNGSIQRVSNTWDLGEATAPCQFAQISANGHYVVFASTASNLVPGDTNGVNDIFFKDLWNGQIQRVSTAADGTQGDFLSVFPQISPDGRWVVFHSSASNLVAGDTNGSMDVFVKDLQQYGTIQRVSVTAQGTQGDRSSYFAKISADGRYVAFSSNASNLVVDDTNNAADIFLKDLLTGSVQRVSTAADGTQGNNASGGASTASYAQISADGHFMVFGSDASNLVAGDTNSRRDVFVKDLWSGSIERLSTAADGTQGDSDSGSAQISADSRYVVFDSNASNLVAGQDTNSASHVFLTGNPFYNEAGALDTVRSSVSFTLPYFVENLELTGGSAINGTGNHMANRITGNAADNLLDGGLGADTLIGGGGSDTYVVNDAGDIVRDGSALIQRVSTTEDGNEGNHQSRSAQISADHRYVVFQSVASNLVAGDTNGVEDIFVKDLQNGSIQRASTTADGTQADSASASSRISADSRYVAFDSYASNLVAGDTNNTNDIFVKDLQTGSIQRVSTATDGTQGNGGSSYAQISADGRYVVFSSYASNLVAEDTNNTTDIFVKDLQNGSIQRVSTSADGTQGNDWSYSAQISADGRYLVFYSYASNLVAGDTNNTKDIFVKDLQNGSVQRVSSAADGAAQISADGRYVAFHSTTALVVGDSNGVQDIYVKDLQTGSIQRVSTAVDGTQGNGGSTYAQISADGRYVVFESTASNLVAGDTNTSSDVFVKDLQTGLIERVSTAADGTLGNSASYSAQISADGRYVLFASDASNLGDGDTNNYSDAFLLGNPLYNEPGTQGTVRSSVSFTLPSLVENLELTGSATVNGIGNQLANRITGNAADNILDGGAGADTLIGGAGNDTYTVDNPADIVTEVSAGGTADTVLARVSYTLAPGSEIESLFLDPAAASGTGNEFANRLVGSNADNVLDGGSGADTLVGGIGNDIYIVDVAEDIVTELAGNGTDTVRSWATQYQLDAEVEGLELQGDGNLVGAGNALNNFIFGNSGINLLDGGAGNDMMVGGAGNDTYVVDSSQDVVQESIGEGIDTVCSTLATYALGANLENLELTGTAALRGYGNELANRLVGNELANILDGGTGIDTMAGGEGDDKYFVDESQDRIEEALGEGIDTAVSEVTYTLPLNVEYLRLIGIANIDATGNFLSNILVGNDGNNTLDGGLNDDILIGGKGNDVYKVDNPNDMIIENPDEGTDRVDSTISFNLADNVENLTLQNLDNITLLGSADTNATGNALANVLIGNAGANVLDGRAAADTLEGGGGDDSYVIDNTGDVVIEQANSGSDRVLSKITYALGANLEHLELLDNATIDGIGNGLDNLLIGNSANNHLSGLDGADTLDGGAGADTLEGGSGDDTYRIGDGDTLIEAADGGSDTVEVSSSYTLAHNFEHLTLLAAGVATGNSKANRLTGSAGSDTLEGGTDGAEADTLCGGQGDDTYLVGTGDLITELANEGRDRVISSSSYSLADIANVEDLELSVAGTGSGNALDNRLTGSTGNDTLGGGGGNDTQIGGAGNDSLDGGSGTDSLVGGTGDDQYQVDSAADIVVEEDGAGSDTIRSSAATYTLPDHVEHLVLVGSAEIGEGNALNNQITGSAVGNRLDGGAGNDSLAGGAGDDIYIVDSAADRVTEYAGGGIDQVESTVGWVLGNNVENLVLVGSADIDGTGNTLSNIIVGNAGNNRLDGGRFVDILIGRGGNDTYVVDSADDVVVEMQGEGEDSVAAKVSYVLPGHDPADPLYLGLSDAERDALREDWVEHLVLLETGQEATNDTQATGNTVANRLVGNSGHNLLKGGTGDDTLQGGLGNDTLDGGKDMDSMAGGVGDDLYHADHSGDVMFEASNEGTDTVRSTVTLTLGANFENLTLEAGAVNGTGNNLDNRLTGNAADNTLIGLAGNDTLDGGQGADTLIGGAGDDDYYVDHAGDVISELPNEGRDAVFVDFRDGASWNNGFRFDMPTHVEDAFFDYVSLGQITEIVGNALDNRLTGNAGGNRLDGGAGADTLEGGLGDDIYVVGEAGDQILEAGNEGSDTVEASIDLTLGANLENLVLTGAAQLGVGNALANQIVGNAAGNTLDGGAGADTLAGGDGDDIYEIDVTNDQVVETGDSQLGGHDTVRAKASYALAANLEKLELLGIENLNGVGNALSNVLVSNLGNNVIDGGDGIDEVSYESAAAAVTLNLGTGQSSGGGGSDTLLNIEKARGSHHNDFLTGNQGNNTLDGGSGYDTLAGGAGSDTYYVDNFADVVLETDNIPAGASGFKLDVDLGSTIDSVVASISYTLTNYVEYLTLAAGSNARTATGNTLDNQLTGNEADNTLEGKAGNDVLEGGSGIDTARFAGNNTDYHITAIANGYRVADNVAARDGSDTVVGIERLQFANITVELTGNAPPVLAAAIADQSAAENGAFSFLVPANSFADADAGDSLSYAATRADGSALPGWLAFDPATRSFSGTPTNSAVGNLAVRVVATDNAGLSVGDTFLITVANTNDAPTLGVPSALTFTDTGADDTFATAGGTLAGSDADGDSLAYGIDGGVVADGVSVRAGSYGSLSVNTSSGAWTFTPDDVAIEALQADATDSFSVTVSDGVDTVSRPFTVNLVWSDTVIVAEAGNSDHSYAGGDGKDTINYAAAAQSIVANLVYGTARGADIGNDTLTGLGNIVGGQAGDSLSGNSLTNRIDGYTGNDSLTGATGNDTLLGGDGNDLLDGGRDADWLEGGNGNDNYVIDHALDQVIERAGDDGIDSVSASVNHVLADNVENLLLGGTVTIRVGGSFFTKRISVDLSINGTGNDSDNLLRGNRSGNELDGLAGNDTLQGGSGADFLTGGLGADRLLGGSGSDTFVFAAGDGSVFLSEADTVYDFELGVDRIGLVGDLDFSDLSFTQGNGSDTAVGNSVIQTASGEYLAVLLNTSASLIAASYLSWQVG